MMWYIELRSPTKIGRGRSASPLENRVAKSRDIRGGILAKKGGETAVRKPNAADEESGPNTPVGLFETAATSIDAR